MNKNIILNGGEDVKDKKIYLSSIRKSLEFFGHDTSHLSDEELEKGIYNVNNLISKTGITANEAGEYLSMVRNNVK